MLQKQNQNINFSQGLDTKTDSKQVSLGKFLSLQNSVFTKGGLLQKRNGYQILSSLPDTNYTYLSTFNEDLTALGTSLSAYSSGTHTWVTKGKLQPLSLSVVPLIRNNLNQTQSDTAIASNGLVCTVYTETDGTTKTYKYAIADSVTGQNIIAPTALVADSTYGTPKVFLAGFYFLVVYASATANNIKFIAISTNNPTTVTAPITITTSHTPATTVAWDAAVMNGQLYVAWNGAAASGIKMALVATNLSVSSTVIRDAAHVATIMSVTADAQNNVVWATYYDSGTTNGYTLAVDPQLALLPNFPAAVITGQPTLNIGTITTPGFNHIFYENSNTASGVQTNLIKTLIVSQATGTNPGTGVFKYSVGLASKPFMVDSIIYMMVAYSSAYQPTYFLVDSSGNISAKIAYQNGGGYMTTGIPSVTVNGSVASVSYLFKDLIQAVNKDTNPPSGTQVAGVYSQTGVNLVSFNIGTDSISTAEIGTNLNISGGFLWAYDGYTPVENGFFLFPDSVQVSTSAAGGSLAATTYYYQVTYEWADNQGNLFRSAPSIPISIVTTGATSSNTLIIPTLRLTYKTANKVKIVVYRWSLLQQSYYQTTSITSPLLNSTTTDSVTFVDTNSDATILGNNLLYTTGGVVENINGPASANLTLFDNRLWLIDSEDPNLLWYSKQVIENTPVEMSDLLTVYVAPTISSQGSTGPSTALSAMDDKLIIFKSNAIYYINGSGPDNTGLNSQYSQPIFITSSVGCINQSSIVLIPSGIMFQSNKGVWLLGRDLQTQYIGAPVEQFNSALIQSSVNVPGTNQVRFTTDSGITLMYDYYYSQWGTFVGVPAVSSTIFQDLHTFIDSYGRVFQENPGFYLDGSNPVLLSFTTSWLNLAGLQGYQRSYFFYLLGEYFSPHKLMCLIAYDYNPAPSQGTLISPTNFNPTFGGTEEDGQNTVFGQDTPFGGNSALENWRVFLDKQRCQAFQITIQEVYDPSFDVVAGQGLTLSGINLVFAVKKGWRPISAAHSTGGSS